MLGTQVLILLSLVQVELCNSGLPVRVDGNARRPEDMLYKGGKTSTDRAPQLAWFRWGQAKRCQLRDGHQALHDRVGKASVAQIFQPHTALHIHQVAHSCNREQCMLCM